MLFSYPMILLLLSISVVAAPFPRGPVRLASAGYLCNKALTRKLEGGQKILRIDFKGKKQEHSITELHITKGHGDEPSEESEDSSENKENDVPFEVFVPQLDKEDEWFMSGLWKPVTRNSNLPRTVEIKYDEHHKEFFVTAHRT